MDPTQYVYDEMFKFSKALGFSTYDFLPRDEVGYPFVIIQSGEVLPRATKSQWLGRVMQYIDVYGDASSRKEVSDMCYLLLEKAKSLTALSLVGDESNIQIIQDQSTAHDLWHGRIQLTFNL